MKRTLILSLPLLLLAACSSENPAPAGNADDLAPSAAAAAAVKTAAHLQAQALDTGIGVVGMLDVDGDVDQLQVGRLPSGGAQVQLESGEVIDVVVEEDLHVDEIAGMCRSRRPQRQAGPFARLDALSGHRRRSWAGARVAGPAHEVGVG